MLQKCLVLATALALLGTAAWAKPPVYFSFASDDFHNGPTFSGSTFSITGKARVDLMVDQQADFEGGVVILPSTFVLEGNLNSYQVVPVAGGNFLHIWTVDGYFQFNHYDVVFGIPQLLFSQFKYAALTSLSPSPFQAGETMTLQDSQPADGNVVFVDGREVEAVLDMKYPPDYVGFGSDFAFTFTNVRIAGSVVGPPPKIHDDGSFSDPWESEGSFSASGGNG